MFAINIWITIMASANWFLLGQPLNCILQPHPKIMAEHQVVVGSYKEISLERRRRMGEYASSY